MNLRKQSGYSHARCATMLPAVAILGLLFAGDAFASGPLEKVIHSFHGSPDGKGPASSTLVADAVGNLYGTTSEGGDFPACRCGTVYELIPPAAQGGAWGESVLYSFKGGSDDGANPTGTLTFDKQGNLYGTTYIGGQNHGTVFELSPPAVQGDPWTETVIYIFPADKSGGYSPYGKPQFDAAGNLYGVTRFGGTIAACDCGTVFELTPPAEVGGAWSETVLHSFGGAADDGAYPSGGGPIFGKTGALYGTTEGGGSANNGAVFQLEREQGEWSESVLYNFRGDEGSAPMGAPIFDTAGNLYGTASAGGGGKCFGGCGSVFELSPPAVSGDPWTQTTLYHFTGGKDGAMPASGLLFDKVGSLYGTAFHAGLHNVSTSNNGAVFELSPPVLPGEAWTETTLHDFRGHAYEDGKGPLGGLVVVKGTLYGSTTAGGSLDFGGTVFGIVIAP